MLKMFSNIHNPTVEEIAKIIREMNIIGWRETNPDVIYTGIVYIVGSETVPSLSDKQIEIGLIPASLQDFTMWAANNVVHRGGAHSRVVQSLMKHPYVQDTHKRCLKQMHEINIQHRHEITGIHVRRINTQVYKEMLELYGNICDDYEYLDKDLVLSAFENAMRSLIVHTVTKL